MGNAERTGLGRWVVDEIGRASGPRRRRAALVRWPAGQSATEGPFCATMRFTFPFPVFASTLITSEAHAGMGGVGRTGGRGAKDSRASRCEIGIGTVTEEFRHVLGQVSVRGQGVAGMPPVGPCVPRRGSITKPGVSEAAQTQSATLGWLNHLTSNPVRVAQPGDHCGTPSGFGGFVRSVSQGGAPARRG